MSKIVMTSFYTGPKGKPDLKPGDVVTEADVPEGEFDRLLLVGGARKQTDKEIEADAAVAAAK